MLQEGLGQKFLLKVSHTVAIGCQLWLQSSEGWTYNGSLSWPLTLAVSWELI